MRAIESLTEPLTEPYYVTHDSCMENGVVGFEVENAGMKTFYPVDNRLEGIYVDPERDRATFQLLNPEGNSIDATYRVSKVAINPVFDASIIKRFSEEGPHFIYGLNNHVQFDDMRVFTRGNNRFSKLQNISTVWARDYTLLVFSGSPSNPLQSTFHLPGTEALVPLAYGPDEIN